jgi:hypothetical protein
MRMVAMALSECQEADLAATAQSNEPDWISNQRDGNRGLLCEGLSTPDNMWKLTSY